MKTNVVCPQKVPIRRWHWKVHLHFRTLRCILSHYGNGTVFLVRPTPRHKSSPVLVLDVKWQSLNTLEMGDMAEDKPASDTSKLLPNQFIHCWFSLALYFAVSMCFTLTRAGAEGCSDLRACGRACGAMSTSTVFVLFLSLQRGRQKFCSVTILYITTNIFMIKIYPIKWYGKKIYPKKIKCLLLLFYNDNLTLKTKTSATHFPSQFNL